MRDGDEPASPPTDGLQEQLSGLAALDDPVRRALYLHVAAAESDVSRDHAAQAAGVSRSVASFHLDRLVAEGLLVASFRRLSGRTGPGAGRPAKLYRRSPRQLEVSVPPRRYELAARLLASAVEGSGAAPAREALAAAARTRGEQIGLDARARAGSRAGRRRLLTALTAALTAQGYQPEVAAGEVRLRNCPFHALVGEHTELVCGMNLALMEGVVAGLAARGVRPVLVPSPELCCVRLRLQADSPPDPK